MGTTSVDQNMWAACFANEVTALRQATGEHFLIVWNPNACVENVPYLNYYPGNAYVNILGLDLYDGTCEAPRCSTIPITWNQLANDPGGLTQFVAYAKSQRKPMSFPEWALLDNPNGDDLAFIDDMGSTFAKDNFAFESYYDAGDNGTLKIGPDTPLSLIAFKKRFP